jgi:hypothetical protein
VFEQVMSLPFYSSLSYDDVDRVAAALADLREEAGPVLRVGRSSDDTVVELPDAAGENGSHILEASRPQSAQAGPHNDDQIAELRGG